MLTDTPAKSSYKKQVHAIKIFFAVLAIVVAVFFMVREVYLWHNPLSRVSFELYEPKILPNNEEIINRRIIIYLPQYGPIPKDISYAFNFGGSGVATMSKAPKDFKYDCDSLSLDGYRGACSVDITTRGQKYVNSGGSIWFVKGDSEIRLTYREKISDEENYKVIDSFEAVDSDGIKILRARPAP